MGDHKPGRGGWSKTGGPENPFRPGPKTATVLNILSKDKSRKNIIQRTLPPFCSICLLVFQSKLCVMPHIISNMAKNIWIPFAGRIRTVQGLLQQNLMSVLLSEIFVSVNIRVNEFWQCSKCLATFHCKTFLFMLDLNMNYFISTPTQQQQHRQSRIYIQTIHDWLTNSSIIQLDLSLNDSKWTKKQLNRQKAKTKIKRWLDS